MQSKYKVNNNKLLHERLKQIHGNKVRLLEPYIQSTPVLFGCNKGHTWRAKAGTPLTGRGCKYCAGKAKTHEMFCDEIKKKHKSRIEVLGRYTIETEYLKFKCIEGHTWTTKAYNVGDGCGCPICANVKRKNQPHKLTDKIFKIRAKTNKFVTIIGKYEKAATPIEVRCSRCYKQWFAAPYNILNGTGCFRCQNYGYSNKSVQWLEYLNKKHRRFIQHELNIGEYHIPNTRYRVDGYNKRTNTVYEFLGDVWHGNPILGKGKTPKGVTYKKAYNDTIKRFNIIKDLGYTIIFIWEHDYDNGNDYKVYKGTL